MLWTIDTTHADVGFAVKHLMISTVKGRFREFTGTGETADDGTIRSVAMEINAASIDTNVGQRDDHLRSPDFLDVANHPTITFRSTAVRQSGTDVTIEGDLTIRGATRRITLKGTYTPPTTDPWGNRRAALDVAGVINRKNWGLTWNQALETGGVVVGEDITVRIEAEAVAVPAEVREAAGAAA